MEPTIPWQQYGLVGIFGGAFVTLSFLLTRNVLKSNADIQKQSNIDRERMDRERERWLEVQNSYILTNQKIIESIERHDEKANERGNYVREEHKEMISRLTEMGVNNRRNAESSERLESLIAGTEVIQHQLIDKMTRVDSTMVRVADVVDDCVKVQEVRKG